jgi:NADPH:quinone reductase-like Zn-dependent oxidoreductase
MEVAMRAWNLQNFGLENLKLVNVPTPKPGPNELLVKVSAVSLNFRDKAIVDGIYEPEMIPKPLIPVSDAAGVVVDAGPNVTRFKTGDRVTSHLYSKWIDGLPGPNEPDYCFGAPLPGGLAEYMIIHEDSAVRAPANMTDEEASTLPIAALTAWFALVEYGNLKAGHTVLVQGTGGVSIFGVQIATALGAKVIATSSSDEKLARVKALGATHGINYSKTKEWHKAALELTNGLGVDQLLEVVGGDGINDSVQATRVGGHIPIIGFMAGQMAAVNLMPVIFRQTRIQGIAVGHRRAFEEMNVVLEKSGVKPVIDNIYPFDQAIAAYQHLAKGAFGKIVITVAD